MRGGIAIAVSNDEDEIITKVKSSGELKKNYFTDYEQELIETLIRKGIINKRKNDSNVVVVYFNGNEDVWRD